MSPELAGSPSFWARYRWDRILMALALLTGLLLVIYGLFAPEPAPEAPGASVAGEQTPAPGVAATQDSVPRPAVATGPGASVSLPEAEPGVSAQFPGNERREEQDVDPRGDAAPDQTGSGSGRELPAQSAVPPAAPAPVAERQAAAAGVQPVAAETAVAAPEPDPSERLAAIEPASPPSTRDAPTDDESLVEPAPEAARPAEPGPPESVSAPAAPEPEVVSRAAPESPSPAPAVRRSTSGPALVLRSNEIVSPSVSRFQITDRIRRREPVGSIEDIREDSKVAGLVRVIVFSSVRNLAGQSITYRWRRGDKVFAEVPVSVGGSTWRSYSSKYLSNDMRGRWTVELVDASGSVLALTEFDY